MKNKIREYRKQMGMSQDTLVKCERFPSDS